jgi:hypothetical protein
MLVDVLVKDLFYSTLIEISTAILFAFDSKKQAT